MLDIFEQWGRKGHQGRTSCSATTSGMVNYYWKIAREAAKRKMLVDFHGSYKPSRPASRLPQRPSRARVSAASSTTSGDVVAGRPSTTPSCPSPRMLAGADGTTRRGR